MISLLLIIAIGFIINRFLLSITRIEWGHHFNFENELGIKIDSLEISVGEIKTMIIAGTDSLKTLEGNINVPKNSFPHKVLLIIYSKGKSRILKAEPFDCYNCDGSHEYKLKETGAVYKFIN